MDTQFIFFLIWEVLLALCCAPIIVASSNARESNLYCIRTDADEKRINKINNEIENKECALLFVIFSVVSSVVYFCYELYYSVY